MLLLSYFLLICTPKVINEICVKIVKDDSWYVSLLKVSQFNIYYMRRKKKGKKESTKLTHCTHTGSIKII